MARTTKQRQSKRRTHEERLAWALWFAQEDLRKWRDGDWLNALEDAADLLFAGRDFPKGSLHELHSTLEDKSTDLAKTWLTALQPALRGFIERLYSGEPADVSFSGLRIFFPGSRGLDYFDDPVAGRKSKKVFVDEILLRVGDLLTRIDWSRLKRCPECDRLFLAVRRQRFDTPRCNLRDRLRRFRSKGRPAHTPRPRGPRKERKEGG